MEPYIHQVHYYETDRMGITHHSNYVRWMEEARVDFLSKIGWDYAKLESMGIISPVTSIHCSFKESTTFSDVVRILVKIEEYKGVRLKLSYQMEKEDGKTACVASSEHCFLNSSGRPIRMNKEFPEFHEKLLSLVSD